MIFEENQSLGGAWRTEFVDQGRVEVEIACHLMENHGNSYSLFSKASGVKFKKLEPEPKKLYENGSESLYFSRKTVWNEAIRLSILVAGVSLSFLSDFGSKRLRRLRKKSVNNRLDIIKKYLQFLRFRLPKFFFNVKVQHPVGGSVAFINGLIYQTKELGVEIIHMRVVSLQQIISDEDNAQLRLTTEGDDLYVVDEAILSNSITLVKTGEEYCRAERPQTIFTHSIYSMPSSLIEREMSYMHFVDNLDVHRSTFLDSHSALEQGALNGKKYILVQFRKPDISNKERCDIFFQLMKKHGIFSSEAEIEECEEHGFFEECFYPSAENAVLSAGVSNNLEHIRVLDTIGDLSRLGVLLKL